MPDLFVAKKNNNIPKKNQTNNPSSLLPISPSKPVKFFACYQENPSGVSFKEQDSDEKILLFLRMDFVTNIPWIFVSIILLFVPIIIFLLSGFLKPVMPFLYTSSKTYLTVTIFYYLLILSYVLANFITWFYNISLITNKKVVDVNYSNIVYTHVALTTLDLVEDVSYIQTGFIRSLFNYGDVLVQTAGENENFYIDKVPNPIKIIKIVENLIGGNPHV